MEEEKLRCPKLQCKGELMEKLPEGDILIDRCPCCGGVFLDGPKRYDGPDELTALLAHVGSKREFRPRREIAEDYFAGMPNTPYEHHAPVHRGGPSYRESDYGSHGHAGPRAQGGHTPPKKKGGFLRTLLETLGED